MRQLVVDDDVFEYLQRHAVPLEDDVNTVLRRLLRLGGNPSSGVATADGAEAPAGPRRHNRRAGRGSILPEQSYELPILRSLVELGGRAPTTEVIDRVGELLEDQLTTADRERLESGDVRWRNRAQFVRLRLVQKGEMKARSPRGLWEISDAGRRRLNGAR